jgi:predicted MFS family arabinose efflux permease
VTPLVVTLPKSDARLERDLRLFQVFRFLSTSYLFIPVLVRFFQERGLDFTQIALLNSVYAITAIVFEVPTGALADRFGRRRAMVLGALLMAAGCLVDFRGLTFWTFAVGEGLLALGMTLTSGADSAYLYDLLRSAGRSHQYRRMEGSATAAKLMGAAAALFLGGLVGRHSTAYTYAATAAVCALAAVVAALMSERRAFGTTEGDGEAGLVPAMAEAGRAVLAVPSLRFAVGFSVLVFTLLRMGLYLYPPYLDSAGLDIAWAGAVLAALSVAGAVGAQHIERVRRFFGESRLVWGLPVAIAATYLLLGRFAATWGVVLLAVQSVANGIYSPLSKELLNREITDSARRATVLSFESMARRLAFGAFAPVAGLLIDSRGLNAGLYACAAVGTLGGAWLLSSTVRRHRRGLSGFEGEMTPTPIVDTGPFEKPLHLDPALTADGAQRRFTGP